MVTSQVYSEHNASQPCCMPILYAQSMVLVHSQPKGIETGYLYFWYLHAPVPQYKVRCLCFTQEIVALFPRV